MATGVGRGKGGGAPINNKNSAHGKEFTDKLRLILARRGRKKSQGLAQIVNQLCIKAEAGEQWAIQMVAERLEGRPAQVISGDKSQPVYIQFLPQDIDA